MQEQEEEEEESHVALTVAKVDFTVPPVCTFKVSVVSLM